MAMPINNQNGSSSGGFFANFFPTFFGMGMAFRNAVNPGVQKVGETLRRNVGGGANSSSSGLALHLGVPGNRSRQHSRPDSPGFPQASGETTRTGVSATTSSLTSGFQRLQTVYDRREYIQDAWNLFKSDPRVERAITLRATAAVKGGFTCTLSGKAGTGARSVKEAQAQADAMLRRVGLVHRDGTANRHKLLEWGIPARVEGDLFLEVVFNPQTGEIIDAAPLPAATMERLTDDADQFPDSDYAFAQIDLSTNQCVGRFARYQIIHVRLNRLGGDRYGNGCLQSVRVPMRELRLQETSQMHRRMANSSKTEIYNVGDPLNGANDPKELQEFMEAQGFTSDNRAMQTANPYETVNRRVFNAHVKADVLQSDPNLHEIDDLKYARDGVVVGLGYPLQLTGYGASELGRDELTEMKEVLSEELDLDAALLLDVVYQLIELQLTVKGLNAESFDISLGRVKASTNDLNDDLQSIKTALEMTLGTGTSAVPKPILTMEQVGEILRKHVPIDNIPQWIKDVEKMAADHGVDPETVQETKMLALTGGEDSPQVGSQNGSANSRSTTPTSGYGARRSSKAHVGGDKHTKLPGK